MSTLFLFFISLKPGSEFIDQVLRIGIDVNGTGQWADTDTPLQAAARARDGYSAQKLISLGAQVKGVGRDCDLSALQLACGARYRSGYITTSEPADAQIVKLLLENGADPSATGRSCCVPALQLAVEPQVVELLLAHGANDHEVVARCEDCEHADDDGRIYKFMPEYPHSGLNKGHNISILQLSICRAFHISLRNRSITSMDSLRGIINVLLCRGARVNQRETVPNRGKWKLGRSALEMAAQIPNEEVALELVRRLLEAGAELEPPNDYEGNSALHYACSNGNVKLVGLLLDHKMDPNRRGKRRRKQTKSPIEIAASKGYLSIVMMLLAGGATVCDDSTRDRYGHETHHQSPLIQAALYGQLDIVAFLLQLESCKKVLEVAMAHAERDYQGVASYIRQDLERRRALAGLPSSSHVAPPK